MPSRQLFMAGPEQGGEAEKQAPKKPDQQGYENPDAAAQKAKESAGKMVDSAQNSVDQLKGGAEQKYEAKPFTAEELKNKTKGYPEVAPAKPADLVQAMKTGFKDQRKEDMDHGDTINATDVDGKEVILLCDKSGKTPKYRLFKQA